MRNLAIGAVVVIAGVAALQVARPYAQSSDLLRNIINTPHVEAWRVTGTTARPLPHPVEGVVGGKAISVPAIRAEQTWTTGANIPVTGEIKQGDTVLVMVFARLQVASPDSPTSRLPVRIDEAVAPYTNVIRGEGEIGADWKRVYASGVATKDYAPNSTRMSVRLATANHTVELGPGFVLNLGQDFDPADLPRNEP
ncbi:hypothetical protein [Brevundimonas sp.]|uniref:hypothetical protein n=1 Tax=Brevundimonas sp. TaxID=1871086 RepID=UPI0037837CCB